MRKTAFLIAGAIAFDLGVLVVASHAATGEDFLKGNKANAKATGSGAPANATEGAGGGKVSVQDFHFYKIDKVHTSEACMNNGGTPVTNSAGLHACQSKQPIPGSIEILSWSWGGSSR